MTIDPLVTDYLAARAERDRAQAVYEEAQSRLVKQMEADQRKSYRWVLNGRDHRLTYVVQHTTDIDEVGLRRALTAKVYDRYTVRKLDRRKMEQALDTGEIDKVTVSRFVSMHPKKPFLTYSAKDAE